MPNRNISSSANLPSTQRLKEDFETYLVRLGYLNQAQLQLLEHEHRHQRMDKKQLLVHMGFLTSEALHQLFAAWNHQDKPLRAILKRHPLLHDVFGREQAEELLALPIDVTEEVLTVIMVNGHDCVVRDKLRSLFKEAKAIEFYHVLLPDFYRLLDQIYGKPFQENPLLADLQAQQVEEFLATLLKKALNADASDIHLEPGDYAITVRLRVDGVLQPLQAFQRELWIPVSTRLKVLANLNIAETRLPQCGGYSLHLEGRHLECRLATHPTQQGESIVIRLLDQSKPLKRLEQLGFSSSLVNQLYQLVMSPQGLIVVTGPTGSGKTTTLYALVAALNTPERKIVTLEDPIEYKFPHIQQTEVKEELGFGFAEGIRSLMRQDPDVILVGEIRDAETALMAVRAALTGHLVLTTLHTSDALGAIPRLQDLGVSTHHLTEVLRGLISQRLVRIPCAGCLPHKEGCTLCHFTGYQGGRRALAEVIRGADIRPLLDQGASRTLLYETLKRQNQIFLHDEAKNLIETGLLNHQEAIRVLGHGPL